jgi:hypothetical protein
MAPGSARSAASSSAAAKASARTTDVELVVYAYLAGQAVPLPDDERKSAVRRALFVFAAGGDPHREPTLDDPAVLELARDLETPERRSALHEALTVLEGGEQLASDPDLAWRAYACALLAEAIGED